jgi:hypothetical protein
MKRAVKETKITNLLVINNDDISIDESVFQFFEDNLLETIRSAAVDEKNDVIVIHCVMDRSLFEQHVGYPVDDATCKIVAGTFKRAEFIATMTDELESISKELGYSVASVVKIDFEFGDGVFHTIAILSKS